MTFLGCHTYCSHGGVCILKPNHEGKHDSGYCQWGDSESLTRDQADDVLSASPEGAVVTMMQSLLDPDDNWVPEEE